MSDDVTLGMSGADLVQIDRGVAHDHLVALLECHRRRCQRYAFEVEVAETIEKVLAQVSHVGGGLHHLGEHVGWGVQHLFCTGL